MYPWQAPASFFPHLEALNPSTSLSTSVSMASTSTSLASTSTPVASTSTSVASTSMVAPTVTSKSASSSVPVKEKEEEKKKERRKLPEQASNVLKDYCTNITNTPTPAQRRELLKLIQTIPGAEWYSTEHISRWFLSRRQAAKNQGNLKKREGEGDDDGDGVLVGGEGERKRRRRRREGGAGGGGGVMTSANILWPTLTPEKITKLTILLHEHSNSNSNSHSPHPPNEGVLEVWARALRAEKDDVWNWVQMNSLSSDSGPSSRSMSSGAVAIKSLPSPTSTSPSSLPSPTSTSPTSITVKQEPPSQSSNLKMSMYSPTESHAPLLLGSPVEQKPTLPISNAPSTITLSSTSTSEETPTTAPEAAAKPTDTKQPRIRHPNPYETTRFKVSMLPPLSLSIPGSGPPMLLPPSQLVRDLGSLVQLPTPVEPAPPSLAITSPVRSSPTPPITNAQTSHSQEELIPLPRPATRSPVIAQHPTPPIAQHPTPTIGASPRSESDVDAEVEVEGEGLIPLPRPATRSPVIAQHPQFAITPTISSPRSGRDVEVEVEVEGLIPLPRPATRSPVIVQSFQGFRTSRTPQAVSAMSMNVASKPGHDMDVDARPTNYPQGPATIDSPSPPTLLQKSPEPPSPSLPELISDSQPQPQPQSPAVGSGTGAVTTPPNPDEQGGRHQAMDVEVAAEAEVESSSTSATSTPGLGMSVDVPTMASSEIKKTSAETRTDVVDSTIPVRPDVPMDLKTPAEPIQLPAAITSPPPSHPPTLAHPTCPHPSPPPSNPSSPSVTDANAPHSETTASIVNSPLSVNPGASAPDVPMDLGAPSDHAQPESEPTLSASPSSSSEDMDLSSPSPSPSTPTSELHYPHDHEPSCTRARNRLAELAVFVDDRLSHSASHSHSVGDCGTLGNPRVSVMEKFSESLRMSEVFFEKIRSGVYSELGLVLRGGEFDG